MPMCSSGQYYAAQMAQHAALHQALVSYGRKPYVSKAEQAGRYDNPCRPTCVRRVVIDSACPTHHTGRRGAHVCAYRMCICGGTYVPQWMCPMDSNAGL